MQKWEYRVEYARDYKSELELLRLLGEQGWENYAVVLVGHTTFPAFYFKRPLQIPITTEQEEDKLSFR